VYVKFRDGPWLANCTGGFLSYATVLRSRYKRGTISSGIGFVWSCREVEKNPSPKMNLPFFHKCAAACAGERATQSQSSTVCVYVPDLGRECCREQWCWRLPRVSLPRHPASDLALSSSRYSAATSCALHARQYCSSPARSRFSEMSPVIIVSRRLQLPIVRMTALFSQ
jgi:hypothetical protein